MSPVGQSITVVPTVEVLIRLMRFGMLHKPVKDTCALHRIELASWSYSRTCVPNQGEKLGSYKVCTDWSNTKHLV